MSWDVVGIGNALMDALVVVDDAPALLEELGLVRGTMTPVDHAAWQQAHDRLANLGVVYDSGGSCANTIATLGRLGAKAMYRGQVGDDSLGRLYTERMNEACGAHALHVHPDAPTGKCLSIIDRRDAERTMLTDLGAAVHLSELGPFEEAVRTAKIAHFTGYTLLDGPTHPMVMQGMRTARDAGVKVSLDAADPFVVHAIKDRLWHVIDAFCDIVFLNAEEARALTELAPEDAGARIAAEARVETVVVKLGARGSMVHTGGRTIRVGIHTVEAVDTTGAGDAYAAGFLYGMVHGWTPEQSGELAAAVAAETVRHIGAVVRDRTVLADILARVTAG